MRNALSSSLKVVNAQILVSETTKNTIQTTDPLGIPPGEMSYEGMAFLRAL